MLSTIISYAIAAGAAFATPIVGLLVTWFTVTKFVRELRRIRIAAELDETGPEYPTDHAGIVDLRDAAQLLTAAEGGLVHGRRRAFWEMFPLMGDAELRRQGLTTATGELMMARQAMQQAALKLPQLGLEVEDAEVSAFDDPVQSLAASGHWIGWGVLTILPRFVRGIYGYRRISRQTTELLELTRTWMDRVEAVRRTVEPAPQRRMTLAQRAALAVA
jgi:hypothetical protein